MRTRPRIPGALRGRPARVLLLLSMLSAGVAAAEAAPNLPDPVPGRVNLVIRDLTPAELSSVAGSIERGKPPPTNTVLKKTLQTGGKFIKYGGNFLFAASLVNDGLNWFYNEAKRSSTNPSLNQWWMSGTFAEPGTYTSEDGFEYKVTEPLCKGYSSDGWAVTYWVAQTVYGGGPYYTVASVHITNDGRMIRGGSGDGTLSGARTGGDALCRALKPAKQLQDVTREDPASVDAVKKIVTEYLAEHPERVTAYLDPKPNENQLNDWPVNPDLDTDRDGIKDPRELEDRDGDGKPDGDPNDPNVTPPLAPGETSVVTTTTRNPDGSITRRTVTTRSDGSKRIVEVTTKKTKTTNPDGSVTTKTTTTTTTTELNPDGSLKTTPKVDTKVEEETDLPPEEEPEPPTEEAPCVAAGGTWGDGKCTMPEKKPEQLPDAPTLDDPDAFKLPNFDELTKKWTEGLAKLSSDASDKFPFGLGNPARSFQAVSGDGSPCPPVQVTFASIKGVQLGGTMDVCGSPMAQTMHSTIRPVLAWFLIGLTVFACARIAGRA